MQEPVTALVRGASNTLSLEGEEQVVVTESRCTKAVPGYRTPKRGILLRVVILLLITLALSSCLRKSPHVAQQAGSSPSASPTTLPKQIGLINDFANVFDPPEKSRLEFSINELHTKSDVEFVVVTVDTTNNQSISDYSLALAREWKPGGNSGRGLVLVLAIKNRQWRLQVSKALEKELPDDVCKQLGELSAEFYKEGNYAEGVDRYVRAIGDRLQAIKSQSFKSAVFLTNPVRLAMRANESAAYHREALAFDVQFQPQMQAQ